MDFVCSDYNWIWGLITDITLNICLVSQTQQLFTRFITTFLQLQFYILGRKPLK